MKLPEIEEVVEFLEGWLAPKDCLKCDSNGMTGPRSNKVPCSHRAGDRLLVTLTPQAETYLRVLLSHVKDDPDCPYCGRSANWTIDCMRCNR